MDLLRKNKIIMAKVYEFLANGFEEVEALAPVDILRRGGVEVKMVSITGSNLVESSHGVVVKADLLFENITDFSDADLLMLPGGMPGSKNLNEHEGVRKALKEQFEKGKRIAAICAAPLVLASVGLLKGKKATIYPGMESYLGEDAEYTGALIQEDGNVTTGAGPAASFPYGYQLLSYFLPAEKVEEIKKGMIYDRLLNS
ncbi:DJ-1 family protein [Prevotella melaninogenica ATCC 25845]|nr:DJ-1 family protein [Prevotella melaninogenica ATCC 25845]